MDDDEVKSRTNPKNRIKKPDTAIELDKTFGQRQIARSANSFKFWKGPRKHVGNT